MSLLDDMRAIYHARKPKPEPEMTPAELRAYLEDIAPKPLNIRVVTASGLVEHAHEAARADATYLNTLRAEILEPMDEQHEIALLLAWRQHGLPIEVE